MTATTPEIDFNQILFTWYKNPQMFTPAIWTDLIESTHTFTFNANTLLVDAPLRGGFWAGDVIAPGYTLPALELSYLRHTRLDDGPSVADVTIYLKTLQADLRQFPAGAWLCKWAERVILCVVYVYSPLPRIIWLSEGKIVAAYQDGVAISPGYHLKTLKPLNRSYGAEPDPANLSLWLQDVSSTMKMHHFHRDVWRKERLGDTPKAPLPSPYAAILSTWLADTTQLSPLAQLDRFILVQRLYTHLAGTEAGEVVVRWLEVFNV